MFIINACNLGLKLGVEIFDARIVLCYAKWVFTTPVDDIESTYLMLINISRTNSRNVILNLLINQQT